MFPKLLQEQSRAQSQEGANPKKNKYPPDISQTWALSTCKDPKVQLLDYRG